MSISGLKNILLKPMDSAGLAVVRILYGIIIIYESYYYNNKAFINNQFTGQIIHFKYRFFEWVSAPTTTGMQAVLILYGLAGFAITLGIFYRLAAFIAASCISYIFLIDSTNYLNHFYLVIIFAIIMFFIPAHRCWSLYALLKPSRVKEHIASWCIWLLRAQLIIVYSYAALAKMNVDWINGMPLYYWIGDFATETGIEAYLGSAVVIYLFTYGGLLYDLLVIPGILYRKTRALAYCFSIGFHLMNYYLFNIGIFPWFMLATTTIFFDSSWPRDFLHFFFPKSRFFKPLDLSSIPIKTTLGLKYRFVFACIFVHLAIQALFPLRHFLYPSYVAWSEEGHNFSWHMKLRDKDGSITFTMRDPETNNIYIIDNKQFLMKRQIDKMATRPSLALQFAHYLRDRYSKTLPIEIYADSWVSLNYRKPQRLIDPTINLSTINIKEYNNTWILPLRQPVWNAENKKNRFGTAFKNDEIAKRALSSIPNYSRLQNNKFLSPAQAHNQK
jgi:hypothetical protein